MRTISPLRYPGGKSALTPLFAQILRDNGLRLQQYGEPYAGGCGLALSLLIGAHVSRIHLNDIDPAIWSFWHSILNKTTDFIDLVMNAKLDISEWHKQRNIYNECNPSEPLELGFATFYLNRTNRSGIIKSGGVIGGLEQKGRYLIDCRFNKIDLSRRIKRISKYKGNISLYNLDAIEFLDEMNRILPNKSLIYADPPYFNKGSSLYTNFYNAEDHKILEKKLNEIEKNWILTYDDASEIKNLYVKHKIHRLDVGYSANIKRVGSEYIICSRNIVLPKRVRDEMVA